MVVSAREVRSLAHARKLGIYGGSFDPVHAGHVHVARVAQQTQALEHVVFVPAAAPPHKPGRVLASPEDRVRMLELALRDQPSWSISSLEFERKGPSYTVDTLRELPARLALARDVELFFLLGWDNLVGLERWRDVRDVLTLAQPIVVLRRDGTREREDDAVLAHLRRELGETVYARLERGLVRATPSPESSSEVRALLARGVDPGAALPPGVMEYIRSRGIYLPVPPAQP